MSEDPRVFVQGPLRRGSKSEKRIEFQQQQQGELRLALAELRRQIAEAINNKNSMEPHEAARVLARIDALEREAERSVSHRSLARVRLNHHLLLVSFEALAERQALRDALKRVLLLFGF